MQEQRLRGWANLEAVAIVAVAWVLVASLGASASPGLLAGPIVLGVFRIVKNRRR